ncbi:MAG TPA: 2'-5' RNA ligase family protein [Cyclobacteriaceae bacterium]|nr:2'-5' RNA ligase family protein [Cyclobacteriaceae bacterium]
MQPNRYLIAILPPEPIAGEILTLKEYFRDQYNSKASLNSPAHITMHMPFEWRADRETKLVETFTEFASKENPFSIELKNFGSFPPRVIFAAVTKNPALEDWQKRLLQFCKTRLDLFNALYRDEPFHPHVTLAFRDLKKDRFADAWEEFKDKSYHAVFECRRLSLLKHDGRSWREFS